MPDISVTHQPDDHRFVVTVDGAEAGKVVYHDRRGRRIFVHTEIDDAFGGMGVGSALVSQALDATRDQGLPVVPLCPFVAGWIERHPDYDSLVDHDLYGRLTEG